MANLSRGILDLALANNFGSPFTPGINPAAPDHRPKPDPLGFLNSPGGSFLMNLLAQQGYSPIPQSPLGAIGRAGIATQQQQRQFSLDDMRRQLFEAQTGLANARAEALKSKGQTGPNIGAVDPGKFTPESLSEFQQTGDFSKLKPVSEGGADLNKIVNEIADDARAESKDFVQQQASYGRIEAAAANPSAFGDLALIFNFMKVLDPGSTVREGEFANAQNSGSVPVRVRALYNNVLEGTRLTESQRADLVGQAGNIFNSAATEQQKRNVRFRQRGRNAGLPDAFIDPILVGANLVDVVPYTEDEEDIPIPTPPGEPEGEF
jgi:hypothetical protein